MRQYRTPLRYPGGKQRLAPFIRELLLENELVGGHYVEPYAGGAGISLELLIDKQVGYIHLNDSSRPIYAFWRSVLTRTDELCDLITAAPLDVEEWKKRREVLRHQGDHNRSGVLTGGVIGGSAQTGDWRMDARFPTSELIRRIEAIADRRDSISLENRDAETFILEYVPNLPANTLVYCDPPYFAQASRLYLNQYKADDHAGVAGIIQDQLCRRWLVSYDNAPEIVGYYRGRRSFVYPVQYSASRAYAGREVFIFSDDLRIPAQSSLPYIDEAIQEWRHQKAECLQLPPM